MKAHSYLTHPGFKGMPNEYIGVMKLIVIAMPKRGSTAKNFTEISFQGLGTSVPRSTFPKECLPHSILFNVCPLNPSPVC